MSSEMITMRMKLVEIENKMLTEDRVVQIVETEMLRHGIK